MKGTQKTPPSAVLAERRLPPLERGYGRTPLAAPSARRPLNGGAEGWRPQPWREARSAERLWRRPTAAAEEVGAGAA